MSAIELIKRHEGIKLKPYKDTVDKWTIGYGRNLDDVGISLDEAEFLLRNDIQRCHWELRGNLSFYLSSPPDIRDVLVDMCYNLGITRLLGFKKMLKAVENKDWQGMTEEMQNSKWAEQVPNRVSSLVRYIQDMPEGTD